MKRFTATFAASLFLAVGTAWADTTIVNEGFETYADQAALLSAWMPTVGGGTAAANTADVDSGYLVGCPTCAPITDPVNYPGIQGQAVDHIGATASAPGQVNQYDDDNNLATIPFNIAPSATQSVRLTADIFVGNSGNERMSVGLRGRDPSAANLIELGEYNTNTCDPTVAGCNPSAAVDANTPGFIVGKGFGYRLQLFQAFGGNLVAQPNWQFFELPLGLDRTTDSDEIVTIGDVGAGWHRYTAVVTPTDVTVSIDLFRDGFINDSRDENGAIVVGSGTPGVDASKTWAVTTNLAVAFDSLRFGGPSGLASGGPGFMAFDNINLALIDVVAPGVPGDYNGSGTVDAADYVVWRNALPTDTLPNDSTPGIVNSADYDAWRANFNKPGSGAGAGSGVPEPTSALLALIGCLALAAGRRGSR